VSGGIILVFVDGLGLGSSDPDKNPLVAGSYPTLESLCGDNPMTEASPPVSDERALFRAIDANLGVSGLPQSGTGQATLFTGINCAELAGRHFGPFPHSTSRPVIKERNLFMEVEKLTGVKPVFANAYPQRFFRYIERTRRWTVTTLCCTEAGVPLRTGEDLRRGEALSADIAGATWPEPDSDHEVITPIEAGRRLVGLAADRPMTVFEYFATDKAGHAQDFDRAASALSALDGLVGGVLASLAPDQTLIVTSDHGNLEDLSVKTHTRNPVPLLARGPAAGYFASVDALTMVQPAVLSALRDSRT